MATTIRRLSGTLPPQAFLLCVTPRARRIHLALGEQSARHFLVSSSTIAYFFDTQNLFLFGDFPLWYPEGMCGGLIYRQGVEGVIWCVHHDGKRERKTDTKRIVKQSINRFLRLEKQACGRRSQIKDNEDVPV